LERSRSCLEAFGVEICCKEDADGALILKYVSASSFSHRTGTHSYTPWPISSSWGLEQALPIFTAEKPFILSAA
jgi:hypothetical protein